MSILASGHLERKAELRVFARQIAAKDRVSAASAAIQRLIELPEFARARTIGFYSAIGDEVDVGAAAIASRARGGRTAYPIRIDAGLEMALADDERSLLRGRSGIGEPLADALRVAVGEIDAFLVPGLLFDRSCRRLGRGGGHYDRLLIHARRDATSIGICYAERVVEELPEDGWDVAMDLVVTEQFVVRRAVGGARG